MYFSVSILKNVPDIATCPTKELSMPIQELVNNWNCQFLGICIGLSLQRLNWLCLFFKGEHKSEAIYRVLEETQNWLSHFGNSLVLFLLGLKLLNMCIFSITIKKSDHLRFLFKKMLVECAYFVYQFASFTDCWFTLQHLITQEIAGEADDEMKMLYF